MASREDEWAAHCRMVSAELRKAGYHLGDTISQPWDRVTAMQLRAALLAGLAERRCPWCKQTDWHNDACSAAAVAAVDLDSALRITKV